MIGSRLSHYELLEKVGAGGMGEVYRARDTRLDREVAVKVLPEHLSENEALKQRFDREARAVSKLSHPHICALHDIGSDGGVDFLVMELLEGETLAERLERGALPVDEVLRYGSQIAQALDRAHRLGVVHRDLKPGNIMLTRSGVKLLDFGLAKVAAPTPAEEGLSELATEARDAALTEEGTILGTFQYMAPEQLEGRDADARSDIFALGVVLYEMATGRRAFGGRSRASVIASIMREHPPTVSSVQPLTPPALEHVISRCLAKDADERWQSAQDVASQLEWISQAGSQAGVAAPVAARRRRHDRVAWLAAGLSLVAALVLLGLWLSGRSSRSQPVLRAQIVAPPETRFAFQGDFADPAKLSPDGTEVLFGARDESGTRQLWVRSLETGAERSLPRTEGAFAAFWAPDGGSVAFFVDTELKRVDVNGGPPLTLAETPAGRGGAWLPDGRIVFSPDYRTALWVVPETGGESRQLTQVDKPRHSSHRWPIWIPGTTYVVYLAASHERPENGELRIVDVESGRDRPIMPSVANAAYAAGRLLFPRESTLMARPFDPDAATFSGTEAVVAQNVLYDSTTWRATFSAVDDRLLYSPGGLLEGSTLTWFDATGKVLGTVGGRANYADITLSPDGAKVAYTLIAQNGVWIYDLERNVSTRLTFGTQAERAPLFGLDARKLYYMEMEDPGAKLYRRDASGLGEPELLMASGDTGFVPASLSPDGRYLLLIEGSLPFMLDADVYLLDLEHIGAEDQPMPLLATSFGESDVRFSPDGRWIAYSSNESGQYQVYVIPFDAGDPLASPAGRWQISSSGASLPRWGSDGKALYFLGIDLNAYRVEIDGSGGSLLVGEPQRLFPTSALFDMETWEVAPDGERFLVNSFGDAQSTPLELEVGWSKRLGVR